MVVVDKREYLGTIVENTITNEIHTIPATPENGYYFIQLNEVAGKKPTTTNNVTIAGFTEVFDVLPAINEFRVDYTNGRVFFNASNSNTSIAVSYDGLGNVVKAEDINEKSDKILHSSTGFNNTGSQIAKGKAVKITGYDTNTFAPTIAVITSLSDIIYGITSEAISSGSKGDVAIYGNIINVLDTSLGTLNDYVFINATGDLTLTASTNNLVGRIAYVNTNGNVFIDLNLNKNRGVNAWVTGTEYLVDDLIYDGTTLYKANTSHTAGATFAGDSANWDSLGGGGSSSGYVEAYQKISARALFGGL